MDKPSTRSGFIDQTQQMLISSSKYLFLPILLSIMIYIKVDQIQLKPEVTFTFQNHCEHYGYPFEQHSLTTSDGYILTIYRIPNTSPSSKGPVLMVHGLSNTANTMIMNMCSKSPGFIMYDEGFDVWFINQRGSFPSRGHTQYNAATDEEYWDFTFIDVALTDIPATIDYVKMMTGYQKIALIGHSQGGADVLWLLSLKEGIEQDVGIGISMGIAAGRVNSKSVYIKIMMSPWFIWLNRLMGNMIVSDYNEDTLVAKFIVAFPSVFSWIASDLYDVEMHGDDPENLAVYFQRATGGTSLRNLEFWSRTIQNQELQPYVEDYGPEKNMRLYGRENVFQIDHSKIKANFAVVNGKYDLVATPEDSLPLKDLINPEALKYFNIDLPQDHSGLIMACNMQFYDDIVQLCETYISKN